MVGIRRSVVNWLSVCAVSAVAAGVIVATTPTAHAQSVEPRPAAPRPTASPTRQAGMAGAGTPLVRSVQAMLARRARRQNPGRFTS